MEPSVIENETESLPCGRRQYGLVTKTREENLAVSLAGEMHALSFDLLSTNCRPSMM
jgi:hypothetical protein